MGKKSKQKAAQAHAAEQARLQQMSTGGQPSAASSQWDLRPLALKGWNQHKYIAPPGGDAFPAVAHNTTRIQRLVTLLR
eukprot:gene25265-16791_t